MNKKKFYRGQMVLEYAVIIAVVAAVLIAMFVYTKNTVQGQYRQAGDVFGGGRQYEPGVTQVEKGE